ncbi:MAG: hypothetical protein MI867_00220 [Pseudomonadales bacterium]|nr:hypothetical protein [Pseudomonadales bacterium]
MGYQVFVQKFENGDSGIIPFEEIESVLKQYGSISEGNFGLEFISSVGEICDFASLSGNSKDSISGVTFDRPTTHEKLPEIIFDLLSIKNTCFFGPDLEYLQARTDISTQLPESLLEAVESGLQVIESANEAWPLQ